MLCPDAPTPCPHCLPRIGRTLLPCANHPPAHRPAEWLEGGALQKAVLVVTSVASKEVLERWTFDIQTDKAVVSGG